MKWGEKSSCVGKSETLLNNISKMTNIIYIHGFGSNTNSLTSQTIRKELSSDFQVITYSFSNDYKRFQAMFNLSLSSKELFIVTFSLGWV